MSNILLCLPTCIIIEVLDKWLSADQLCNFDTAVCNSELRPLTLKMTTKRNKSVNYKNATNNLFLSSPVAVACSVEDEDGICFKVHEDGITIESSDIVTCPYVGCPWRLRSSDVAIWSFHVYDVHTVVEWNQSLSCKFAPGCTERFTSTVERDAHEEDSCSWERFPCKHELCNWYGSYPDFKACKHLCFNSMVECENCGAKFCNFYEMYNFHLCKNDENVEDGIKVWGSDGEHDEE